ncbi:uncharacterized protein BDZ83DRAFT_208477 [Colletotrichum acutatum]|uniref:Secreted protein n=1 Tax=Glomerella acutata TaxID=27357 RepID=A0AAD8U779_GLOAC|nr:uncharacterized protein BDZ83DRAFT_208477 [Colletotrichum acutatum]KAK1705461.1 hypothetical protein BDZ83DRAFT_208477 [Colletotrichum acutatum]
MAQLLLCTGLVKRLFCNIIVFVCHERPGNFCCLLWHNMRTCSRSSRPYEMIEPSRSRMALLPPYDAVRRRSCGAFRKAPLGYIPRTESHLQKPHIRLGSCHRATQAI